MKVAMRGGWIIRMSNVGSWIQRWGEACRKDRCVTLSDDDGAMRQWRIYRGDGGDRPPPPQKSGEKFWNSSYTFVLSVG